MLFRFKTVVITTILAAFCIPFCSAQEQPRHPSLEYRATAETGEPKPPDEYIEKAKKIASERYNVPLEDLVVTSSAAHRHKTINKLVFSYAVSNPHNVTQHYGIHFDEKGAEVDDKALYEAEKKAYFERYGSLEPELYDYLKKASQDEYVPLRVYAVVKKYPLPYPVEEINSETPDVSKQIEAYIQAKVEYEEKERQKAYASIIAHLRKMGYEAKPKYNLSKEPEYTLGLQVSMLPKDIQFLKTWDKISRVVLDNKVEALPHPNADMKKKDASPKH